MYRICTALLLRAAAFPSGIPAAQPLEVRNWFSAQLDRMAAEGRGMGLLDAELEEAGYALVAFIDEQVLRSSWPGREEWMKQPLQLLRHRENVAGENFFRRLRALLRERRHLPAVQIYALCLALGFRGVYQQSSDAAALGKFQRAAFDVLFAALPARDVSSPHLERQAQPELRQEAQLLLWAVCAALLLVPLVLAICSWSVHLAERRADHHVGPSSAEAAQP